MGRVWDRRAAGANEAADIEVVRHASADELAALIESSIVRDLRDGLTPYGLSGDTTRQAIAERARRVAEGEVAKRDAARTLDQGWSTL